MTVRVIMSSKVFIRFACVALVAATIQVSLVSPPSAQTVSTWTAEERTLMSRMGELLKAWKFSEAIPLQERLLAISEKSPRIGQLDVATQLNNLAYSYDRLGRYADAELLHKRALAIREKSLGPNHPDVAYSLQNLADLYQEQGRYADAEPLYKRALAIFEKSPGPDPSSVAKPLNSLAVMYENQGRYAEAEPLNQRSLAIQEKWLGPNHPDVATSLNNLARLYSDQGRNADAEPLYKRALAIWEKSFGADHPQVAIGLNNLAALYQSQGRYADAAPLLEKSLAIFEKFLGADHPNVATLLSNLGVVYQNQGRLADAAPLLKRALVIREKALGPDHPDVATSLNNLAGLYRDQGRYSEAEPLFKRTLAILEASRGPDHPNFTAALSNLAAVYRIQDRYADALPLVRRTIAQGVANRAVAFPVLFQSQRQKLISAAGAFDDSYDTVQRATSSAAASAVSKLAARFAAGTGPLAEFVRQDQDLTAEYESLDKSLIAAISKPPAERKAASEEQIRKRIEAIKSDRAKLQEIFNQRFPDYVALSKPQPLSSSQTQALLSDDEALVVFDFNDSSYAWVVTRTDFSWIELKVSNKDLDADVKALRQSLGFHAEKPFDPQLAFKVYQATFGAFADKIAAKKRLSVVTNGALTSLPPALLVTRDPAGKALKDVDWLIRSHAITILPSVSSLKILRTASATPSAPKSMIAFGDPVFSKAAHAQAQRQVAMRSITTFYSGTKIDIASLRERLPQLPGTRTEVQAIAKAMNADAGDIKLGLAVTETAVKQTRLDQYRIAYFATHGLVAGDLAQFTKSKAEPALALTIPDNASDFDDGLLSASEIAQLKLNADWVVLSACNTAAEEKPGAEALSGLARAFFYAGARSLIVSHWEVDDEATARLMTGTFQASIRDTKLSHGEALRQSMLALIDNAKSDDDAQPRLWAPFVVVGEPAKPQ
jgi:CHAT domain-containing protein/Tfp pilus assembly protein PilF